MKKLFLVETVSMFRIRYVIETENADYAADEVVMNNGNLSEFSQKHLDEVISSTREIDEAEYLRLFDADNDYLMPWDEDHKFKFINRIEDNE